MSFPWARIFLCTGLFLGCGNPQPTLSDIEPKQAYSDYDVRMTLTGTHFLPATILDPVSGQRIAILDGFSARIGKGAQWAPLAALSWQSTEHLTVLLESTSAQSLPIGPLDVEITDPRGEKALLTDVFQELGLDSTKPIIDISPAEDTPFEPGKFLRVTISVSDNGQLSKVGYFLYDKNTTETPYLTCEVAPNARECTCAFQIKVSANLVEGDQIQLRVDATDNSLSQNTVSKSHIFTVQPLPKVSLIDPKEGGTAGGTDVIITGSGFLSGSQVLIDGVLLNPNGGIVVDENTISGHVPSHAEGRVSVVVHSPVGTSKEGKDFTYKLPPLIETITPNHGDASGNAGVTITGKGLTRETRIYFGKALASALPLNNPEFREETAIIVGHAPAGTGMTTVWAYHSTFGFSSLPNGFVWVSP
jgi:hypothetical protein